MSQLSENHCLLNTDNVIFVHKILCKDDKVALLQGLSVLEICLVSTVTTVAAAYFSFLRFFKKLYLKFKLVIIMYI